MNVGGNPVDSRAVFRILLWKEWRQQRWIWLTLIVPACFAGLVMVIAFVLINSVVTTFTSATWTLAYREMTGKELQVAGEE